MGITAVAREFLGRCRVISPLDTQEGIIVTLNLTQEFVVKEVKKEGERFVEEEITEFRAFEILGDDDSQKILNFKKKMYDIVGRKRYYIEDSVYEFLSDTTDPIDPDDFDSFDLQRREALEREEAEQAFDYYLRVNGM